jgi:hypothetical protein
MLDETTLGLEILGETPPLELTDISLELEKLLWLEEPVELVPGGVVTAGDSSANSGPILI